MSLFRFAVNDPEIGHHKIILKHLIMTILLLGILLLSRRYGIKYSHAFYVQRYTTLLQFPCQ